MGSGILGFGRSSDEADFERRRSYREELAQRIDPEFEAQEAPGGLRRGLQNFGNALTDGIIPRSGRGVNPFQVPDAETNPAGAEQFAGMSDLQQALLKSKTASDMKHVLERAEFFKERPEPKERRSDSPVAKIIGDWEAGGFGEGPEAEALRDRSIEKALQARGPLSTVNINNGKDREMGKATWNKVEAQAVDVSNLRGRGESTLKALSPELVDAAGRWRGDVIAWRDDIKTVPFIGPVFGKKPTAREKSFRERQTKLKTRLVGNMSRFLNELSGAAISPKEEVRLREAVASWGDAEIDMRVKLIESITEQNRILARLAIWQEAAASGGEIGKHAPYMMPSSTIQSSLESAFNDTYEAIRADPENEGLTDEQVEQAAQAGVEERYGISGGGLLDLLDEMDGGVDG